jgi:hypothetical protein
MRVCSNIVVLLGALMLFTLFGCAGAKHDAKAPETNPWSDYKGTWAPGGSQTVEEEPKPAKVADAKPSKSDDSKPAKADKADAKADKADKPAKADKAEAKTVKVAAAESKPAKIADPKPSSAGDSKPVKTEMKPDANDARAMYGVTIEPKSDKSDEPAEDTAAPVKTTKKRGGKKAGAKKPGARAKR